ncbi:unnamed protein product, partial [Onchocerca flexuosa]|uniref:Uncharacterized protein n=1 Tax=Onchocerca flexuosa TaxID=387005 RepID=A0A183I7U3_9BILA
MSAGNWMTSLLLFATPPDEPTYPPAGCIPEFLIGREKEDRLAYIQKRFSFTLGGPCCSLLSPNPLPQTPKCCSDAVLIIAIRGAEQERPVFDQCRLPAMTEAAAAAAAYAAVANNVAVIMRSSNRSTSPSFSSQQAYSIESILKP